MNFRMPAFPGTTYRFAEWSFWHKWRSFLSEDRQARYLGKKLARGLWKGRDLSPHTTEGFYIELGEGVWRIVNQEGGIRRWR